MTTKKATSRDRAANAADADYTRALAILDEIRAEVIDRRRSLDSRTANWGHAGTAAEVREQLTHLADMLTGRGEYAS